MLLAEGREGCEAKERRMYTIGQFSTISRLPAKTLRYYDESYQPEEADLEAAVREGGIYLTDPSQVSSPDEYVTEIVLPVE